MRRKFLRKQLPSHDFRVRCGGVDGRSGWPDERRPIRSRLRRGACAGARSLGSGGRAAVARPTAAEEALADQVHALGTDRARLASELDDATARARALETANREVAQRIDQAIDTIRGVLSRKRWTD